MHWRAENSVQYRMQLLHYRFHFAGFTTHILCMICLQVACLKKRQRPSKIYFWTRFSSQLVRRGKECQLKIWEGCAFSLEPMPPAGSTKNTFLLPLLLFIRFHQIKAGFKSYHHVTPIVLPGITNQLQKLNSLFRPPADCEPDCLNEECSSQMEWNPEPQFPSIYLSPTVSSF